MSEIICLLNWQISNYYPARQEIHLQHLLEKTISNSARLDTSSICICHLMTRTITTIDIIDKLYSQKLWLRLEEDINTGMGQVLFIIAAKKNLFIKIKMHRIRFNFALLKS